MSYHSMPLEDETDDAHFSQYHAQERTETPLMYPEQTHTTGQQPSESVLMQASAGSRGQTQRAEHTHPLNDDVAIPVAVTAPPQTPTSTTQHIAAQKKRMSASVTASGSAAKAVHSTLSCGVIPDKRSREDEGEMYTGVARGWKRAETVAQAQPLAETGAQVQGLAETGAQVQGLAETGAQVQGLAETGAQVQGPAETGVQVQGLAETGAQVQGLAETRAQVQGLAETGAQVQGHSGNESDEHTEMLIEHIMHTMTSGGAKKCDQDFAHYYKLDVSRQHIHRETECAENLEKNRLALVQEIANAKTAQNDAERELREAIAAAEEAKRNAETALHAADKQYSKMSGHQAQLREVTREFNESIVRVKAQTLEFKKMMRIK